MTSLLDRPYYQSPLSIFNDRFGWHTRDSLLDTFPELEYKWNVMMDCLDTSSIYFCGDNSILITKGYSEEEYLVTQIGVSRNKVPYLIPSNVPYKIQLEDSFNDLIIKQGCFMYLMYSRRPVKDVLSPAEEIIKKRGYMHFFSKKLGNLIFTQGGTDLKNNPMYRVKEVIITPSGYLSLVRPSLNLTVGVSE